MDDATLDRIHADFEALLNSVMRHATKQIRRNQPLLPYGAVMDTDREIDPVMVLPAVEDPDPAGALEALRGALSFQADDVIATATVIQGPVDGMDAVSVELEHRDGLAVRSVHRYRRGFLGRVVFLDEEHMEPIEPQVWRRGE